MSLFGAATSGVSPQTGSYLSKEERIAMFKSASGRSGYRGRSSGGGGGGDGGSSETQKRPNVEATSAIVAVNTMTSTIQKLQVTNQQTIEQVQVQVERNRENIANLYETISAGKEQELQTEKQETRQERRRIELGLRAGAESMLEGLGKAVAKTSNALGKVADKSLGPVKGFLDKLFELLSLLGAAWVIDNLPAILKAIDDFIADLPTLGEALNNTINFLTGTRGVFSILDRLFQPLKNLIGKIAKKAVDFFYWVGGKITTLVRKIFSKVKKFVVELFSNIARKAGDFFRNLNPFKKTRDAARAADAARDGVRAADSAADATKAAAGSADDIVDAGRAGQKALPEGKPKPTKPKNLFDWFGDRFKQLGNWSKKQFQSLSKGGKDAAKWVGGKIDSGKNLMSDLGTFLADRTKNLGGMKSASPKQVTSFLDKMLGPFVKILGPASKGLLKGMIGILQKIPGIGMLIDIAMNRGLDGMSWTESIMRGVGSGGAGALGGWAGAQAGGLAGAAIGTVVPGIGNVIGGVIGAAIGGFLGAAAVGAFGDEIGKVAYKYVTGKDPTQNDVMFDKLANESMQFLGDSFGFEVQEDVESEVERRQIDVSSALGGDKPDSIMNAKIPATNFSSLISSDSSVPSPTLSTPEGMQLSDEAKNSDETSVTMSELPPNFFELNGSKQLEQQKMQRGEAQFVPSFSTTDSAMDDYRTFSKLAFEVAS